MYQYWELINYQEKYGTNSCQMKVKCYAFHKQAKQKHCKQNYPLYAKSSFCEASEYYFLSLYLLVLQYKCLNICKFLEILQKQYIEEIIKLLIVE